MSTEDLGKIAYDVDEAVAAPPEEKKVDGLGQIAFVGPKSKAKAKQTKNYGHITSAEDYIDALKKIGIDAQPTDWVVYFPESKGKLKTEDLISIDEMLAKLQPKNEESVDKGTEMASTKSRFNSLVRSQAQRSIAMAIMDDPGFVPVLTTVDDPDTGHDRPDPARKGVVLKKDSTDERFEIFPNGRVREYKGNKLISDTINGKPVMDTPMSDEPTESKIDEMLAKLSKTEESAKDKVVNVSLVDLEKLLSAAGELAGQTINNPDWKRETLRGWADKVYDAIEPFEDLIKNIDFTYEPGEPPDVDEAKISMPQVIDQITRSLDDLAQAEDPHTSVDALRDIISAVAGGLLKLGEKKSAATLSKIAMEIQPSEEPAVATSKESVSFTNI